MNNSRGISPVISIVIIVSVSIAVAISVALWMSGIIGGFTKYEKIEIKATYAETARISQWMYRIPITITEQSGNDLTDYQVLVNINTLSLINAGKMKSDGGDIRFFDSDGVTSLSYWIESGLGTSTTRIWVKIPSIPADGQKTIYMLYGNQQASSRSDATSVFDFYGDFDDADISNWYSVYATITATVFNGENVLKLVPVSPTNFKHIAVPIDCNLALENYIVEARIYDNNPAGSVFVHFKDDDNWWGIELYAYKHIFRPYINNVDKRWVYTTSGPTPSDTWYLIRVDVMPNRVITYIDGTKVADWTISSQYQFTGYSKVGFVEHRGFGPLYADWIRVRRYTDPEPSVTIGSEEEAEGIPGWIVSIVMANTGEVDATITDIMVNGRSLTSYSQILSVTNKETGEVYYNATLNKFETGVPLKIGEKITLRITITMETPFKHGSNIEVKIKTASGQEYPKTIQLP